MIDTNSEEIVNAPAGAGLTKFSDPLWTAKREARAHVGLRKLNTLWVNTGTLCNIECLNCYIHSSPTNDELVYFKRDDLKRFLSEIEEGAFGTGEIGFTGGEPFMNPEILEMIEDCLVAGLTVLVLTNAMQPMMRPRVQHGLLRLLERFGDRLTLRVSLDHHSALLHDKERGSGSFDKACEGLAWLARHGFAVHIAGRTMFEENEAGARAGYARLFKRLGLATDAMNPAETVLFPEMDEAAEVPEITTQCWSILGVDPAGIMCATSRMLVHRKGEDAPVVLPCTLLPHTGAFDMGATLDEARAPVSLNHVHCAKFCVLGGGSCSA